MAKVLVNARVLSAMSSVPKESLMAVYFDHKIQAAAPGDNRTAAWHKTFPILAVSCFSDSNGASVNLYTEEGEHLAGAKLQRNYNASSMAWHPVKKILAVGWENGELMVWNEADKEIHDAVRLHNSEISILSWTSNGTRLMSGDANGDVVVWKADSRGRLQQTPLYKHEIGEHLVQAVLKPAAPVDPNNDIASLARAAVSGDENALDMFNWKKGKNNSRISAAVLGPQEAVTFFLGGKNGGVYYLNDAGKIVQCFRTDGPVRTILYYEEKTMLITITTTMMLSQHNVSTEGEYREMLTVKMSGKSHNPDIIWAAKGILATATGESIVRMWDIDKEENFVLNLEGQSGYDSNELITCISFCPIKGVLAGGTTRGHVAMWKYAPLVGVGSSKHEPEDKWKLQPPSSIEGSISQLCWGASKGLLAVNTVDNMYILSEQVMNAHARDQVAVVQSGPTQLLVDFFDTGRHHQLGTDIQIKGLYTTKEAITVWDGKKVVTYEIKGDGAMIQVLGTFSSEATVVCLHEQNVYTLEPGKVQVRTPQGTVKQLLTFTELEGDPVCMEVCKNHLVVGTSHNVVKVFDLSRREAKQSANPKVFGEVIPGLGSIISAKCNCTGSRVSIIVSKGDGSPDPKVYVWDVEHDAVQYFNFESGRGEQDEYMAQAVESDADTTDADRGKNQAAKDIAGRQPISHYWDTEEQKLLVCEAKYLPLDQQKSKQNNSTGKTVSLTKATMDDTVEVMVVSLFVTQENGILIQDSFAMSASHNKIIGLEVPYFYFMKQAETQNDSQENSFLEQQQVSSGSSGFQKMVHRRVMRDFVGLETADQNARNAMMDFSYYLTIGNMDEAFKAIKLIKSESVWENMAKMCVKTRRLDVAAVCLGNMGHARGAKMVREAVKEPELDTRVAVLAMQLSLEEDAERLLKNSKRYDVLNEFYQSTGQWGKAMETAEMYDRVHLRTTYYNYAKHLESKGDVNGAIPNFEKSDTHRFEVPRMLFDEPQALESYIMKTKDIALRKWWAQYMESTGEMETALQYYEAAQDVLSLVRVHCYCGDIEKASKICNDTGDRAACYHLARQYENQDKIKDAIHFFTRAQAYGNAIRLCKDHGMEDQLMNLALLSKPQDMVEAARYYEHKPGAQDKAVMLYHKAGHFSKALDLAFRSKQFGALQMISEDLDDNTDPQLLQRCADFFVENGQFDRAVDLLAVARKYWDALKMCMEQNVPVNEALVEKLTPSKDIGENEVEERNKILEGIAEVCMQQRQYHLATKKYTQAGNKVKAMKALLKSGDTEKIVFFAGVSRQKEIYVMAANYLQSLDWRKDPEIMKNIIGFYTKGRALDLLAGFYDACGQVEIDEYQNYDKAVGALSEAFKCLSKAKMKNQSLQEEKLADLKNRIAFIKKFIQARRVYDEDAEEAIKQCQVLLQENNIDAAVRIGDIFGLIVEHYARKEKWKPAYSCLEEMRARIPNVNLSFYVGIKSLEAIHRALDIPMKGIVGNMNGVRNSLEEEDGEEVEEDVVDDFNDEQSNC